LLKALNTVPFSAFPFRFCAPLTITREVGWIPLKVQHLLFPQDFRPASLPFFWPAAGKISSKGGVGRFADDRSDGGPLSFE